MREILFKARRKDNGEWVEGYYCRSFRWTGDENPVASIQEADCYYFREVDSETICQYTGLTNKNGSKIWENDIVTIPREDERFVIRWSVEKAAFAIESDTLCCDFDNYWGTELKVIGNVFDNPDLLEA